MQKLTRLRNWLEVMSQVSLLIFLSLMLLAWIVPSLSTKQVLNEYSSVLLIGIMPGLLSLRIRESKSSKMKNKTWTLDVIEDQATGDALITFPDDFLAETGWKEGDVIEWIDNKNGTWTIKKKEDK